MKKFLRKIWDSVKQLFQKVDKSVDQLAPIAINIVQGVKTVVDGPVDDIVAAILKKAIPGVADDVIIDKVHQLVIKYVPEVLGRLLMIQSIASIPNPNDQLQAIVKQLRISPDEQKNIVYHNLATLILEKLADGKLTWGEAAVISEYVYQNKVKLKL